MSTKEAILQTKFIWRILRIGQIKTISFYTWSYGRHCNGLVERIIDRAFRNHLWLTTNSTVNVSTLSRLRSRSDHYPLLLEANFSNHVHTSNFKFLSMTTIRISLLNVGHTLLLVALCVF